MSNRKKIGAILARLTRIDNIDYRIDFTRHDNEYDSDDEEDNWQWSHPIRFSYKSGKFLNTEEITYDTRERHTARIFWENNSTTITKMIEDTMTVRKAKGEVIPEWSISKLCNAGDMVWYKYRAK